MKIYRIYEEGEYIKILNEQFHNVERFKWKDQDICDECRSDPTAIKMLSFVAKKPICQCLHTLNHYLLTTYDIISLIQDYVPDFKYVEADDETSTFQKYFTFENSRVYRHEIVLKDEDIIGTKMTEVLNLSEKKFHISK